MKCPSGLFSIIVFLCFGCCRVYGAEADPFFSRQPYEVTLKSRAEALQLIQQNLSMERRSVETFWVWVDEKEHESLIREGFVLKAIEDPHPIQWQAQPKDREGSLTAYHSYEGVQSTLERLVASHPDYARLVSIGKSVQGRDLWMLKITDNPDIEEQEPEFLYIATIHGNEPLGTEMVLQLAEYLLVEQATSETIHQLVCETEIWLLPLMNPDGHKVGSRFNANGSDLNRDYPDRVLDPVNTSAGREVETQALMNFIQTHKINLAGTFHTGALVVNYPYDSTFYPGIQNHPDWFTPDNDFFVQASTAYASNNPGMAASSEFPGGITNGIDWYVVYGGIQDWCYGWPGTFMTTIEISNTFAPSASLLPQYWNANRASMLTYLRQVHQGIRGTIVDASNDNPLPAEIHVQGNAKVLTVEADTGHYFRLLPAGTYSLEFSLAGYQSQTHSGVVVSETEPTFLNIRLEPLPTATPTFTVTPSPTASPSPDFDLISDGTVNSLDLLELLERIHENEIPERALLDLSQYWMNP